ncbi:ATP-binding protein [Microbacterium sp. SLBN-146]|uniref:ATP-binding protein n=1 Tax=Microbacterium sp. SLBN-146 TaxID=2768457 RepID=UPI001154CD7C|nr:ATP-binding protein [Microbacterium sp. SLBN-146]TQJ30879.1 hypothetical protein FBY39_1338 [Microbacterium sp. SLBN-146]
MDEPDQLEVVALGARIVVRIEGDGAAGVIDDLRERWRRCLHDDPDATARTLTYRLGPDGSLHADALRHRITVDVTAAALDECRGDLLTLHAAGLEDSDVAYCFVGPSGAGKSTLASRLGRELGYAGDEAVGVDDDGRLIAFPKPLSLRSSGAHDKQQVGPDALGLRPASGGLPIAGVFVLDRQTDAAEEPATAPLGLVDAVVALARQSSYLPQLDRPLQRVATLIHRHGAHRLTYGESADVLSVVREAVAQPTRDERWEWSVPIDTALSPAAPGEPAVRRVDVRDAIEDADGTVVLLDGTDLQVLSPLGSLIWRLTADWTRIDDIEQEIARMTGADPSASEMVRERLAELVASDLLEMRD